MALSASRSTGATVGALRVAGVVALAMANAAGPASAQGEIARERAEFVHWLAAAPTSPLATVAQQPIGRGVRLGPADADIPLAGVAAHVVAPRGGGIGLEGPGVSRLMPRGLPVPLRGYTLTVDGPAGREVLTVFGPRHATKQPAYYPVSPGFAFVGTLLPPEHRGTVRLLGVDGIEVEAAEAGSVVVPLGGVRTRLRVRRLPSPGGEESELEIFFRDETNGRTTYPAGRFVSLVPAPGGGYRLDFNRARNPFCAYSSAYACPAPWQGNTIPAAVTAGERYHADSGGASELAP
jgi:uncharacterized protein DUF1684